MRVDRLLEHTEPNPGPVQKEAKVEVAGGTVGIVYYPPPAGSRELPLFDLLNLHLIGWNATDEAGQPAALNADVIVSLAPEVKDAFRDAILGRKKAADKPEKPPEKPVEPAHGSFEPVAEKEQSKSPERKRD
jgi:hypothetical protein